LSRRGLTGLTGLTRHRLARLRISGLPGLTGRGIPRLTRLRISGLPGLTRRIPGLTGLTIATGVGLRVLRRRLFLLVAATCSSEKHDG
jgi:hypothetical protein